MNFSFGRASAPLANGHVRPAQYDLTPTLVLNRTEQQIKEIENDIRRAKELAPHTKPLERGRTLIVYDELMMKFKAE